MYRDAAVEGYADAQVALAGMYESGQGLPRSDKEASAWFRKAADQHHAAAELELGLNYMSGQGVERDGVQAFFWLSRAVNHTPPPDARVLTLAASNLAQLSRTLTSAQKQQAEKLAVNQPAN